MSDYIELQSINAAQHGMNGSHNRQQAISQNIANVNTPGYKRREVSFEDQLQDKYLNQKSSDVQFDKVDFFQGDSEFFGTTPGGPPGDTIEPVVSRTDDTTIRNDGNNVDPDRQMAKLTKNSLYFQGLSKMASSQFQSLNSVIGDLQQT